MNRSESRTTDRAAAGAHVAAELSAADRDALTARGLSTNEVASQLARLRRPARPRRLDRPCVPGDGVHRIGEAEHGELLELWRGAARAGRLSKLVPASGAATRMFADLRRRAGDPPPGSRRELERRLAGGDDSARAVLTLLDRFADLPFAAEARACLERAAGASAAALAAGAYVPLLSCLLEPGGLALGERPKGLLPFHRYADGARSAFVEHLVESAPYLEAGDRPSRLHFTILAEHRASFEAELAAATGRLGGRWRVDFSTQSPSSDTVALASDGSPLRDARGRLVLRPSGHGALLANLERHGGDLTILQNIDNVPHARLHAATILWKRLLVGYLVRLERQLVGLRQRLEAQIDDPDAVDATVALLGERLALRPPAALTGAGPGALGRWARDRLARPLRVCGVVPSAAEPGGGPFWMRGPDDELCGQIVERSEIDRDDPGQQEAWAASTHFNPVNVVCSLRHPDGTPHRLAGFVDDRRYLVVRKSHAGEPILAHERPGLWNGSMAGWNTAFVETPAETFHPVKTVLDLLRPAHQPAA